ncbi:hypothetical protein BDZ97DRAFT_2037909, partial [Flammula alnicola]
HFFTQIPQPMHRNSEMKAILSLDLTSIQSLPEETLTSARTFLHSCAHRFGLQRLASTMAIRVILSDISTAFHLTGEYEKKMEKDLYKKGETSVNTKN